MRWQQWQAVTHIRECHDDSNWYTPHRGRTWQHVVRATLEVTRTTTISEVPTKSKLGPDSRDEVLAPSDARPGRHPGLPHSLSNKPPWSREVRFDKVVTGLLCLSGSIKPNMRTVQIKASHRGQNDVVLHRHMQGLPSLNLKIAMTLSPPFPSEWTPFC
jgi:hypothetical protein